MISTPALGGQAPASPQGPPQAPVTPPSAATPAPRDARMTIGLVIGLAVIAVVAVALLLFFVLRK